MRHAPVTRRYIDIVFYRPAVVRRDERHVHIVVLDFGKKYGLFVKPPQPRSICQPEARLSTEHRHDPSIPAALLADARVRDPGTVGGENWTHFPKTVIRELNRLAVGQHLDVDLAGTRKSRRTANKCNHATV